MFTGLMLTVASAEAGVQFCNQNTEGTLYMAVSAPVGAQGERTYRVSGWYEIPSGVCERILQGSFKGHQIFAYADLIAVNNQVAKTYSGPRPLCVHPSEPFRHTNTAGQCTPEQTNAGMILQGFFSFTPATRIYTVNFAP